mmetsp:Transcript_7681/g.15816  ORF Transcript_7681/g.15816 Transcript_7681/m.15816 type:complete len:1212 (+) Transcript_7681:201-3836(+)
MTLLRQESNRSTRCHGEQGHAWTEATATCPQHQQRHQQAKCNNTDDSSGTELPLRTPNNCNHDDETRTNSELEQDSFCDETCSKEKDDSKVKVPFQDSKMDRPPELIERRRMSVDTAISTVQGEKESAFSATWWSSSSSSVEIEFERKTKNNSENTMDLENCQSSMKQPQDEEAAEPELSEESILRTKASTHQHENGDGAVHESNKEYSNGPLQVESSVAKFEAYLKAAENKLNACLDEIQYLEKERKPQRNWDLDDDCGEEEDANQQSSERILQDQLSSATLRHVPMQAEFVPPWVFESTAMQPPTASAEEESSRNKCHSSFDGEEGGHGTNQLAENSTTHDVVNVEACLKATDNILKHLRRPVSPSSFAVPRGSPDRSCILSRQLSHLKMPTPQQESHGKFKGGSSHTSVSIKHQLDGFAACVEAAQRKLNSELKELQSAIVLEAADAPEHSPLSYSSGSSTMLERGEALLAEQLSKIRLPLYAAEPHEFSSCIEQRQGTEETLTAADSAELKNQPVDDVTMIEDSPVETLADSNISNRKSRKAGDEVVSLNSSSSDSDCATSFEIHRGESSALDEKSVGVDPGDPGDHGYVLNSDVLASFDEIEETLEACLTEINLRCESSAHTPSCSSSYSPPSCSSASWNGQSTETVDSFEYECSGGDIPNGGEKPSFLLDSSDDDTSVRPAHIDNGSEAAQVEDSEELSNKLSCGSFLPGHSMDMNQMAKTQELDELIWKASNGNTNTHEPEIRLCTTTATHNSSAPSGRLNTQRTINETPRLDYFGTSTERDYVFVEKNDLEGSSILLPDVSSWEFLEDAEHDSHHDDFLQSQKPIILEVDCDEEMRNQVNSGSEYEEVTVSEESRSSSSAGHENRFVPRKIEQMPLFRNRTDSTDLVAALKRRKRWLSQATEMAAVPPVEENSEWDYEEEESSYEEETIEPSFEDPLARALAETREKIASGVLSKRNMMAMQKLHSHQQKHKRTDQEHDRNSSISSDTMSMTFGSFTSRSDGDGPQKTINPIRRPLPSRSHKCWGYLRRHAAQVVRNNLPKARAVMEDSPELTTSRPKMHAAVSLTFLADPLSPATVNRVLCQAWDLLAPGGTLYITHVIHRQAPGRCGRTAGDGANDASVVNSSTCVTSLGPYVPKRMKDWILRVENNVEDSGSCRDVAHRVHELETLQLLNGYKGGGCTYHPQYDRIQRWKGIKPALMTNG